MRKSSSGVPVGSRPEDRQRGTLQSPRVEEADERCSGAKGSRAVDLEYFLGVPVLQPHARDSVMPEVVTPVPRLL